MQIGVLTLAFQVTASLLQPAVGIVTDRWPMPYSLPVGMASTFVGLILLRYAPHYAVLVFAASLIGLGLAVFHSEASRVAPRLGRAARLSPVVLPGRRQRRQRGRPAARRLRGPAARPGERRLVRRRGDGGIVVLVDGVFFGIAFGAGGLGAAALGGLADARDIAYVYWLSSFLPLLGLVAVLLPRIPRGPARRLSVSWSITTS